MTDSDNLPELTPDTFINRELGTIAFQRRVLSMAGDESLPLLERLKFIAIVGGNLDEFFMVRVASYVQKIKLGIGRTRPDGYTAAQLVPEIREQVRGMFSEQRRLLDALIVQLGEEGVNIITPEDLTSSQHDALKRYFKSVIFPVLTPLAADHARPFPFISNLSLNLGVFLERESEEDEIEFARIKVPVPDILNRLVSLNEVMQQYSGDPIEGDKFLWVEDVIREYLSLLFPGMTVLESHPFRVLRNVDIDYEHEQEDDMEDVMSIIEQSVRERRFGSVVRLSVLKTISDRMLNQLYTGLQVRSENDVYMLSGAHGTANLFELASVDRPDLKFPSYVPKRPDALPVGMNIFEAIRRHDIILHHPYDSFAPVEEFFVAAANDPDVLAIKATLYRVGKNSPVVQALMDARDNDKQVTVLVELKARFDEENNLGWARAMEAKGVHVIYGVEELSVKTHAKIALVVRREGSQVRRYLHLGTGNYNASTARVYTDLGLFTANPDLGEDASRLFNRLTGYAPDTKYKRLLIAPDYLLNTLIALVDNEIAAAKAGKEARIILKMNQLEEDKMIQKLYQASQAGVQIDIIVRGFCCLRPGVPGVSDNIRVKSIIGRFLEHSRIYYFQNAPEEQQMLAGSADIMRRNLYNRVEVVFPILDPRIRLKLMRILATNLLDNARSWDLHNDGTYTRCQPQPGETIINAQRTFTKNSFGLDILP
ncbi:MAG: polyphosphate kinase 1 [Aggregatilineales bacterium]